jgi:ArsR family transcriptional regulator
MNTITTTPEKRISRLLKAIDQPARIQILLAIGGGEACVCHLESLLGLRQAYISQHLMALRDAELVTDRREGRYIFYRLTDDRLLKLIQLASDLTGIPEKELMHATADPGMLNCCCPNCASE